MSIISRVIQEYIQIANKRGIINNGMIHMQEKACLYAWIKTQLFLRLINSTDHYELTSMSDTSTLLPLKQQELNGVIEREIADRVKTSLNVSSRCHYCHAYIF